MQRDSQYMQQAIELARRGEGAVEPNPMVGALLVHHDTIVGQGWHQAFGAAHAEVEAIRVAGDAARGSTLYVTLEPCCHHGKTPPCTDAILKAGIARVVVALEDPFEQVAGGGIDQLRAAGIDVTVGILESEAEKLCAPYLKLERLGIPWVIAKWAMTLDGKIATRTGKSQWISNRASRDVVHQIRGRMDAILVGRQTAQQDDPMLTARPPGPRIATRVVLDTHAALSPTSQLVRTTSEAPVLLAVGKEACEKRCETLVDLGCEIVRCDGQTTDERLAFLLKELGRRRMTNLLVEGGGELLGSFFDAQLVDETHVFIAPKVIGGQDARPPVGGRGMASIPEAWLLSQPEIEILDGDVYLRGRSGNDDSLG